MILSCFSIWLQIEVLVALFFITDSAFCKFQNYFFQEHKKIRISTAGNHVLNRC